jgi:hypothetical protein
MRVNYLTWKGEIPVANLQFHHNLGAKFRAGLNLGENGSVEGEVNNSAGCISPLPLTPTRDGTLLTITSGGFRHLFLLEVF